MNPFNHIRLITNHSSGDGRLRGGTITMDFERIKVEMMINQSKSLSSDILW